MMRWSTWVILILVLVSAGWMVFDGSRALIVGDYVTPASGEYAGQLGPWTMLVEAIGIAPRSTLMKTIFVLQGSVMILMAVCYALKFPWARTGLLIVSILGLWFLPFGTLVNLIVIVLLLASRPK